MAIKLRNRWTYKGNDWWDWEAFLDDGGTGELAEVKSVEYLLHPTFSDPVRTIESPQDGFVLKTTGWGTFTLKAFAQMKDGSKRALKHTITLNREPASGETS